MVYRNSQIQKIEKPTKRKSCWFFHNWVPVLLNPEMENFYFETIKDIACLECSKCRKTKELKSMSDVDKAQEIFAGKCSIRTTYG